MSTPESETDVGGDPLKELQGQVRALEARAQRAEAERDELSRRARAAEDAVRARDEILAVIAHDLRNPLGTIVMGASALDQFATAADTGAQRLRAVAERIQRQANRMVRQLANLTDFVEIEAGRLAIERERHPPSAIFSAANELIGGLARERSLALEISVPADLPPVTCDLERVVQVLFNLCSIAIKVTPSGEMIEIGARRGERGRVELFVRDHGPGIDRKDLTAMFEPSWQTTQSGYKGTGLGFAIARGIVAAHGGRIWADSTPGAGTTVYFSLAPED